MLFCDPALQETLLEIRDKSLFKSYLMINLFSGKWQIIDASWILSFLTPPHWLLKSLSCQYPSISFENTVYLSFQHSLTLTSKCLTAFIWFSASVILVWNVCWKVDTKQNILFSYTMRRFPPVLGFKSVSQQADKLRMQRCSEWWNKWWNMSLKRKT